MHIAVIFRFGVPKIFNDNLKMEPNSIVTWLLGQQGVLLGLHVHESWKLLGWFFTYGKIDARDTIHDDKDVGICKLVKAVIQAHRKHEYHQLQVKVKRRPRCRLMFRNGGNNRNVVLGIRWIQQRIEATSPGRDFTSEG